MEPRWRLRACAFYGALAGLTIKLLFWRGLLIERFGAIKHGEYAIAGGALVELVTLMAICAFIGFGVGLIRNLYSD